MKVRQIFDDSKIIDLRKHVEKELTRFERSGEGNFSDLNIAIAVGSRGIKNIDLITKAVVDFLISRKAKPFIVPAMGSHGGSTAEGQRIILESYGVNQDIMGVPIISSMDTVHLGKSKSGLDVFFDRFAFESDMVIPINRIKPHTDYKAKIESGLSKMLSIGLGKRKGCETLHHNAGLGNKNFSWIIPEVANFIINHINIGFGIGIVENAYGDTNIVRVVPPNRILEIDEFLLKKAKKMMAKILIPDIDVLIIENFGKDITGAGMDPNITGRPTIPAKGFDNAPDIKRIIVLNLTKASHGNACAISEADFITQDFYKKIDFEATYENSIAGHNPGSSKIPMVVPNEEVAIELAIKTCHGLNREDARIVKIKDTSNLDIIQLSENIKEEIGLNDQLELLASS